MKKSVKRLVLKNYALSLGLLMGWVSWMMGPSAVSFIAATIILYVVHRKLLALQAVELAQSGDISAATLPFDFQCILLTVISIMAQSLLWLALWVWSLAN